MNRYAERTRATQASEKYSNLDYELDLCYLEVKIGFFFYIDFGGSPLEAKIV